MNIQKTSLSLGDKTLELEIGRFAEQTNAAVLARCGDTLVLSTVVMSQPREDIDYFPLFVEYQEKLYAGGIIKGSRWVKREGRPSDEAILTARLIDRSIRPLFPEGFNHEVQVVVTVLSVDGANPPDIPAIFATSTALALSDIPWDGPVGALRLGLNGDLLINPTHEQQEASSLDLVISATKDAILMVEAGANEVSEDSLLKAFKLGHDTIKSSVKVISDFASKYGKKKISFTSSLVDPKLITKISQDYAKEIDQLVTATATLDKDTRLAIVDQISATLSEKYETKAINQAINEAVKKQARKRTLTKKVRPDGREPDEIRPISCEVGLLPRTHGSAMFKRGATQALTITTLASPALEQLIESMEGEESKRYIHHYFMPPYTVGEVGRLGWPSRREIGHGALAERALLPMIPEESDFPYTIRVVSELMSSNGSTSMASVCGSTLALMDAGVPIKKPVAGIAMGLITDGKSHLILSDIQGMEDHTGDMDFKVAGTKDGITSMQMDVKIAGISFEILKEALDQAKKGRLFILDQMLKTLPAPRSAISKFAPKIKQVKIPVDKIGELIGPGGRVIRQIIAETGAQVDVNDDGNVSISAPDQAAVNKAVDWVTSLTREVEVGEEFDGTVARIQPFGAFVEILPGKDGLVHVSKMSTSYVSDPNQVVKIGDKVHVRVSEIDDLGRINLTMLTPDQEQEARDKRQSRDNFNRSPSGDRNRGGGFRSDSNRGPSGDRRRPSTRDRRPRRG
jgi:polyribonucleotide nucleotidyltransferase